MIDDLCWFNVQYGTHHKTLHFHLIVDKKARYPTGASCRGGGVVPRHVAAAADASKLGHTEEAGLQNEASRVVEVAVNLVRSCGSGNKIRRRAVRTQRQKIQKAESKERVCTRWSQRWKRTGGEREHFYTSTTSVKVNKEISRLSTERDCAEERGYRVEETQERGLRASEGVCALT